MDFIKFEVHSSIRDRVIDSIGIPFKVELDPDTGEIQKETWRVSGWSIVRKRSKFTEFSGNLSYCYSGIKGQQLMLSEIRECLENITNVFGLPSNLAILRNLEINLDVELEIAVSEFLRLAKYYRTTELSHTRTNYNYKGSLETQLSNRYKLYDREWIHRKKPGNILRVESHFNKMQGVCNSQVRLSDLGRRDFVEDQHKRLIDRFNQTLLIETLDETVLTDEERLVYDRWNDLQFLDQIMKESPIRRKREKNKLSVIYQKHGENLHAKIIESMTAMSRVILDN